MQSQANKASISRLDPLRCELWAGILHYHSWQTQTINIWWKSFQDSLYLLWRTAGGQLSTTGGRSGRPHLPHRHHPLLYHEGEAVCHLQQEFLLVRRRGENISWTTSTSWTAFLHSFPFTTRQFLRSLLFFCGFQQPTFDIIELVNLQNSQSDNKLFDAESKAGFLLNDIWNICYAEEVKRKLSNRRIKL